ncbi:MAG: tetratricopeptide repeat protein [Oscillospiraceae bacterium]|nr:tetratricopeptide repeat protein [Oscillospiraceae bacterium]
MKKLLSLVCLILCTALLFTGCAYRKAQKLYDYEAYDDAAELLEGKTGKRAVKLYNKARYGHAVDLFSQGKFQEARDLFIEQIEMGEAELFLDTICMIQYREAIELLEQGELEEAEELFIQLDDYLDAPQYVNNMKWDYLLRYLKENGQVELPVDPDGDNIAKKVLRADGDVLEVLRISKVDTVDLRYSVRFERGTPVTTYRYDLEMTAMQRFFTSYNYLKWDMTKDPAGMPGTWDKTAIEDSYNLLRRINMDPSSDIYIELTHDMEELVAATGLDIQLWQLGITLWPIPEA